MDERKARIAYCTQQLGAARRGIEWKFSFESWLEWWGKDLDKRGSRSGDLCMQRIWDIGPYSPENCVKGTPLQNAKTRGNVRTAKRIGREVAKTRKTLLGDPFAYLAEDGMSEDEQELYVMFKPRMSEIYS